jgi:hypothetical protein
MEGLLTQDGSQDSVNRHAPQAVRIYVELNERLGVSFEVSRVSSRLTGLCLMRGGNLPRTCLPFS